MYTAELFGGGLSPAQLANKEAARRENKKKGNRRKCRSCPTLLRTDNRASGICDRCREKGTQTTTASREDFDYLWGLRSIKKASGMSWIEIAYRTNIEAVKLSSWASEGKHMQRAPLEAQNRLVSVLGVTLEELRG